MQGMSSPAMKCKANNDVAVNAVERKYMKHLQVKQTELCLVEHWLCTYLYLRVNGML